MGRTADVLAAAAAIVLGFLLLAFRDRYAADQVRLVDRLGVRAPGGEPLQRFLAVMLGVLLAVFGAFMIIRG
jgi:hypothetical protein